MDIFTPTPGSPQTRVGSVGVTPWLAAWVRGEDPGPELGGARPESRRLQLFPSRNDLVLYFDSLNRKWAGLGWAPVHRPQCEGHALQKPQPVREVSAGSSLGGRGRWLWSALSRGQLLQGRGPSGQVLEAQDSV